MKCLKKKSNNLRNLKMDDDLLDDILDDFNDQDDDTFDYDGDGTPLPLAA